MACSNCNTGLFINATNWSSGVGNNYTSPNGTQVTISAPDSLSVSKGGAVQLFNAPSGGQVHYMHWGTPDNFLAVLTVEGGAIGTRTVVLVNTASASLSTQIITTVLASSSTSLPHIYTCPGDGSVILTSASNDTELTNIALWTADTGDVLCSAGSISATLELAGEVTATQLQIKHGGTVIASCPKPQANASVSPATVSFADAVLGAGVDPSLATHTSTATITNNGSNCLTINNVSSIPPFSVTGYSKAVPVTLQHNESLQVDLQFAPSSLGTFDENLTINPAPPAGSTSIHCHGQARAPHLTLSFNDPLGFGNVPAGSPAVHRTLTIHNTGEADITVTIPAPPAGSVYQWTVPSPASQVLHPSGAGSTLTVDIAFAPTVEGTFNQTLVFTSTATGSPHTVHLNGAGCIPRPVIQVPNTGPLDMGDVQQGFRTVRLFKVRNAGNALLQFSARIVATIPGDPASEAAAQLFGLLQDSSTSVTAPLPSFLNQPVDPTTACGSVTTGSGDFDFGVAFFADIAPAPAGARLEIFNHNDTTSGAPASFFINLTATVVNPVSVDVEIVLDRSGSMADPSGSRIKIETARDAARLFVQLSRPDVQDRVGLVRFNDVPEVVQSIEFITSANQAGLAGTISPANFSPAGFTAIAGGVLTALADMDGHPRATVPPELNKIVIVLTDGHDNTPYLNPADGLYYTLLGGDYPGGIHTDALPTPSGVKIYAVGIGDSIDVGRLGQLSASTGGAFLQAREFSGQDFFNLEKHFTQIYMEAVNYAQISDPEFDILPGETHVFQFEVLPGDKSAIVVLYDHLFRLPFVLLTPHGEMVDLFSVPPDFSIRPGFSPTARFMEINMPQGEPDRYAGTWTVKVWHDRRACYDGQQELKALLTREQFGPGFQPVKCRDNFNEPIHYGIAIGAGSNFTMVPFVTPGPVRVGEPIQLSAMLSEYGLPITGSAVQVKAVRPDGSATMHTLADDGLHGDDAANDGTYGVSYVHTYQAGTYVFTFTASGLSRDGKPVKREAVRSKYVEGSQPLIPTQPSGGSTGVLDKCCRRLLYVMLVFGALIALLLLLIWLR